MSGCSAFGLRLSRFDCASAILCAKRPQPHGGGRPEGKDKAAPQTAIQASVHEVANLRIGLSDLQPRYTSAFVAPSPHDERPRDRSTRTVGQSKTKNPTGSSDGHCHFGAYASFDVKDHMEVVQSE